MRPIGDYPAETAAQKQAEGKLIIWRVSAVTTTERVFVIRDDNGRGHWVNIHKRPTVGNLIEIQGDLKPGEEVIDHATDEIRNRTGLNNSGS